MPHPAPGRPDGHSPADDLLDAATFERAVDALVERDVDLAQVVQDHGRPGFWSRPATFATLVLFILEQQVSLASGKAVFDRFRDLVGEVRPEHVAGASPDELRAVGMTRQKASYVGDLARGILDGTVDWDAATSGNRDATRRALLACRGVGPWTADVWLLACRGFADEWPVGDRALQVGTAEVVGADEPLVGPDLVDTGRRWAPTRSVAARLVWHDYLARRDRVETVVEGLDHPG